MRKQCVPGISPPPSQTPWYEARFSIETVNLILLNAKCNYVLSYNLVAIAIVADF